MGSSHSTAAQPDDKESCGPVTKIGESFSSVIFSSIDKLQGEVLRQTRSYKEIAGLTYEDFLEHIGQLNQISGRFLDSNGKTLAFAVKKGSDSTPLWKGTVRVACVKLDSDTKAVESCRLLNLKEFLAVYKSVQTQAAALRAQFETEDDERQELDGGGCSSNDKTRQQPPLTISHSMLLQEALEGGGSSLEECCVCLERRPDLILPCAHSYCTQCIQQWNVNHKTCPVCRETLETTEDGWVISDGPDSLDITIEIQKSLMELAHS